MDFNDSKDEAAFRAEAAAWLKDNVPSKDELAGLDELAAAKLWQKRKYDAGWACIRWDKEFGGRGASARSGGTARGVFLRITSTGHRAAT